MHTVPAIYQGRVVRKDNFRAYVYNSNKDRHLVNSWDEFERAIASGMYFPSIKEIKEKKVKSKRKRK